MLSQFSPTILLKLHSIPKALNSPTLLDNTVQHYLIVFREVNFTAVLLMNFKLVYHVQTSGKWKSRVKYRHIVVIYVVVQRTL